MENNNIKFSEIPYRYTGSDNDELIKDIKNAECIDLGLIPKNPMIEYFDNNGNRFYQSNEENAFFAIRLMIAQNKIEGYYCTIESEWWDDNDDYQGSVGKRNYKKFMFLPNGDMEEWCTGVFQFPFECLCTINKIKK